MLKEGFKSKKKILFLLAAILMMAMLAGCGSKEAATNDDAVVNEADANYVVNIGYYNCDHMTAACIAQDTGIYEELGLNVNITGNGRVPDAMSAGKMDVGYIGFTGLVRAQEKGAPIFIAANNHKGGAYYLVVSNNIKDPKDLIGKKFACGTDPEKNNPNWVLMAEKVGLPVEGKNYECFDMGISDAYFALKTGKLDGYLSCDPWGSMAEYEGTGRALTVYTTTDTGEWGDCCVLAMNTNFVKEHPELAKKMALAHTRALEYIYTHPLKAAAIFAENYNVPEEVGIRTIYKKTVGEGRTLTWAVDPKEIDNEISFEVRMNTLENAPDMAKLVDTQYLDGSGCDNFDQFIQEKVDPVFPLGMTYYQWLEKAKEVDA